MKNSVKVWIIFVVCFALVWFMLLMSSDRVQGYCNYSPALCSSQKGGNWTCVENGTNAINQTVYVRSRSIV